jgi:hypothetical protein
MPVQSQKIVGATAGPAIGDDDGQQQSEYSSRLSSAEVTPNAE